MGFTQRVISAVQLNAGYFWPSVTILLAYCKVCWFYRSFKSFSWLNQWQMSMQC